MNKLKCKSSLQLTLDDDFNVPDVKPDIYKIIKEQGGVKINDVKMLNSKLMVKGSLYFNMLYLSDENQRPVHNISGEVPFEEVIQLNDTCAGDDAIVNWELEDLSTGIINSRKISVKSIVRLAVLVEELYDEATAVSVEGDDNVEFISKNITVTNIAVDKKDTFRVKDQVHLPSNKGNIAEILYSELELRNTEVRLQEDRFSVKGELLAFILYSSEDEENPIDYMETEIPFSSVIECNGCSEDMIEDIDFSILSRNIDIMPDMDGEERILDIEAVIEMGIKIFEEEDLELLNDVYSPHCELTPVMKEANYENLLVKNNSKVRVYDRVKVPSNQPGVLQICHSSGAVKIDEINLGENELEVNGVLEVQILYICADDNRPFNSIKGIIPFAQVIEVRGIKSNSIYNVKSTLEQLSVMMLDSEEIEVKAGIGLNAIVFDIIREPIITDLKVTELDYEKLREMPSMVGYIVKNQDSLWTIAKKFYTTRGRIMELNHLEEETIKPGDKLLIMKKVNQW
jgi:hypothetical protein